MHEPSYDVSKERWNNVENYWPGDDYVDCMGIDGFNFFPQHPERNNPVLQNFDDCFEESYYQLSKIEPVPIR